jgi:uncharacterized membrane protein
MDSVQIEQALAAMDTRLARIEAAMGIARTEPVKAAPAVTSTPAPMPLRPTAPVRVPAVAVPGNWLGIIAVICFVLAAAFIVKLSIESGWLTPSRQIGLAALLGLGLIGTGLALRRADRAYAALLPAAGIVILYLVAFAAHRFYGLINFESALVLTSLTSGLCVWLYTELRHDMYAFTAAAGAYLAPVVLEFHSGAVFSLYYFLLCSAAFAAISIWVRSRTLTMVAAYLAILVSGAIGIGLKQDALVAQLLAVHFVIFAIGSWFYTVRNARPLTVSEAHSFLPVLLIFYAMEYYFIDRIAPDAASWIALGFAAALIALYAAVKTSFADSRSSQGLILSLATIVIFHAGYLDLMPGGLKPYLFSAILLAAAWLPGGLVTRERGSPFLIPGLALLAIMAIEYLSMLGRLWQISEPPLLAALAAIAAIWTVLVQRRGLGYEQVLLGAAHLMALAAFYRLAAGNGSLAVSVCWLLYGAGVIVYAFRRKDELMAKSALFVLAFAAGKALLVDAARAPTILRILCLLLTGAVLYACGLLMRKFRSWGQEA